MLKFKNTLLTALSRQSRPFLAQLQPVTLEQRDIIYDIGSPIEHVYFMESAVGSVLMIMQDGGSIEVGMVGYEGLVGVSALLGETISQQHIVIQLPGKAYKIKSAIVKEEFEQNVEFRQAILRFVDSFIDLSGQTAACNRLHQVDQRCARWLLMSSDRTQSPILPLTQEYLAAMVGVRRSGISEAAAQLQRKGLISYRKGKVEIINRPGLEKAACECYQLDGERFRRLVDKK